MHFKQARTRSKRGDMTAKERPAGGASGPKEHKFKSPASSLRPIAARAQALVIEHATTADLPDGRQMPPLGDGWHALGRISGTRWRWIGLRNPHEKRALPSPALAAGAMRARRERETKTIDVSKDLGRTFLT